ncbi:MAG: ABC transporter permease, partial [Limnohabitans sp.]
MVLLLIWDLVVRFGLIKPILLPAPIDTLLTLINGMAGPVLLPHFWVTLERTLYAFAIATAV